MPPWISLGPPLAAILQIIELSVRLSWRVEGFMKIYLIVNTGARVHRN
jgi:hypothetical protein